MAVGLALLLAVPARANTVQLVADAHVVSSFPTVNFGSVSNLYVGNGSFALLQYNLSSLPSGTVASQVNVGQGGGTFTITASAGTASGTSETVTLTLAPVNGFNQAVALSCSGLPANSTCGFSSSNVTLNGTSPSTTSLTITTQSSCSNTGGSATFSNALLLPIVFFFGICSRRKRLRAFFFAACLLMVGSGCAGQKVTCYAPEGSYTITVTGASKVGTTTITQTTTITFTVGSNGAISTSSTQ